MSSSLMATVLIAFSLISRVVTSCYIVSLLARWPNDKPVIFKFSYNKIVYFGLSVVTSCYIVSLLVRRANNKLVIFKFSYNKIVYFGLSLKLSLWFYFLFMGFEILLARNTWSVCVTIYQR